jgi:hypothetical protein
MITEVTAVAFRQHLVADDHHIQSMHNKSDDHSR